MLAIVTMKSKANGSLLCHGFYKEENAEKLAAGFREKAAELSEFDLPRIVREDTAEFMKLAGLWPQGGMWVVPAEAHH